MSNKLYEEENIRAIAEAIRQKGVSGQMTVGDMAGKVLQIPTGSGGVPFRLGGMNAEKVDEYTESWTLADTSFVIGSTPSSSTIKSGISNRFYGKYINFGDKDIVIIVTGSIHPQYSSAATNKARSLSYAGCYYTVISKRPTVDGGAKTERMTYRFNQSFIKYYNSSGSIARAASSSGFYMTLAAPTISSTTGSYATVKCSSPTLSCSCSTSYLSTDNCKAVTACDFNWSVEVYAVDPFTTPAAEMLDRIEQNLVTL